MQEITTTRLSLLQHKRQEAKKMLKRDDVNPEQYKDYIKMLERKIKRLKPLK